MNVMTRSIRLQRALVGLGAALLLGLTACGGSDVAPPAAPIGAAGGVASGPDGAQVSVPAGALAQATSVSVDQSSAGAPALPATMAAVGKMFALTPHGTSFAQPVTVRIPFDATLVAAGLTPMLLKTNAAQTGWDVVAGATVTGGFVEAGITGFSWIIIVVPPTLPTISSSPADQAVVEASSVTFAVGATGPVPSGALRYQWQRDGVDISGATGPTYTLPATTLADSGAQFRAVVSNNAGSVTSAAATLTVTVMLVAPAITQQPVDVNVAEGSGATFNVVATGTNVAFQWQRSNDGGITFANLASASLPSYSLPTTALADNNARFRVIVSNSIGGVTSSAATLTVTAAPPPSTTRPIKLAAGGSHSVAILANGSMIAWGDNSIGNLGDGTTMPRSGPVPVLVINDGLTVAASSHTLVVRSTDGSVWAWGNNDWGQIGDINNPCSGNCPLRATPARSGTLLNAVSVAAGSLHSLAARADGTVWAWGNNDHGQLGDGTTAQHSIPNQVPGLSGVVMVAAHGNFSLALKGDGTLWAWGYNNHGQLGDGTTTERHVPVRVTRLAHVFWIAAGFEHAIAIDDGGAVQHPGQLHLGQPYVWGSNQFGQLGTGSTTDLTTPQAIAGVLRDASGGGAHTLLLHSDNVLFGAGLNAQGEIGDGTTADRSSPAFVSAVLCEAVSAGAGHSLCADTAGQVWAWGQNTGGQVGDGTFVNRPTPVRVNGVNIH